MIIRHLSVSNFRGINSLDWHVSGELLCLLGAGDSTKTTILDSIELALSPRWNVSFYDTDFYCLNTSDPIQISVSLGTLSSAHMSDDTFGLFLKGYDAATQRILDDPEDGSEPIVTVLLEVSDDLEPHWYLTKAGLPNRSLTWRERESINMARLGNDIERHLTWGRGSALSRITASSDSVAGVLSTVSRSAVSAVRGMKSAELDGAAEKACEAARRFGVGHSSFVAGLDARNHAASSGALSLHDTRHLPARSFGLGTRRLTSLAIQHSNTTELPILLIDEIEQGLEPHRIRNLIRQLKSSTTGQIFFTTHSPTSILELDINCLRFVTSCSGVTEIISGDSELQPTVRSYPHVLLARKIVVCEGKTEEGMFAALEEKWAATHDGRNCANIGVVAVEGGGSDKAPKVATHLSALGYEVHYFGDSDVALGVSQPELERLGIKVSIWPGATATEQRVATDVSLEGVQEMLHLALTYKGEPTILQQLGECNQTATAVRTLNLTNWISSGIAEQDARELVGNAAKQFGWFKSLNKGRQLGDIVTRYLGTTKPELLGTIQSVRGWIYGG